MLQFQLDDIKQITEGTMKAIVLTSILTVLILSGCGDSEIESVKSYTDYSIDQTMTIGQAIDTSKTCIDGSWSTTTDERQRTIVTYSCLLPSDYIEHLNIKAKSVVRTYMTATSLGNDDYLYMAIGELKESEKATTLVDQYISKFIEDLNITEGKASYSWYIVDGQTPNLFGAKIHFTSTFCDKEYRFNNPRELLSTVYMRYKEGKIPTIFADFGEHLIADNQTEIRDEISKSISNR
jgi:hypothetical protein